MVGRAHLNTINLAVLEKILLNCFRQQETLAFCNRHL